MAWQWAGVKAGSLARGIPPEPPSTFHLSSMADVNGRKLYAMMTLSRSRMEEWRVTRASAW